MDRADQVRVNPDRLRDAMMRPNARLLKLDGLNPVFDDYGNLAWGAAYEASPDNDLLLLGMDGDTPCFAELNGAGNAGPGCRPQAVAGTGRVATRTGRRLRDGAQPG